jgi:redox-sensitive bicupin YhaK (pirin superfamily)
MLHFTVKPGGALVQPVPSEQSSLVYVFKGTATIGSDQRKVTEGQAALLGSGDSVNISVGAEQAGPAEILLLSGKPLHEPVARYGPFVMNTREEIEQAFRDFQSGKFGLIAPRT